MTTLSQDASAPPAFTAKGVVTFLYYEDVRAAVDFYQRIVGLEKAEDFGWCCLLRIQPRTFVGLVNATDGSQRPVAGPNKGVVLSIEIEDLDGCLERMVRIGAAPSSSVLTLGCGGKTREFKILDPGGYAVEFFRWLTPDAA